jgi:hypothetical protein
MQDAAGLMVDQPELWLGRCNMGDGTLNLEPTRSPSCKSSTEIVVDLARSHLLCETKNAHISSRAKPTCHLQNLLLFWGQS